MKKESQIRATVDWRTPKVTGRTEQFNFKARKGLKKRVDEAAEAEGITIAEWMERAIETALKLGGKLCAGWPEYLGFYAEP